MKKLQYFGHHKAATTSINKIISMVCEQVNYKHIITTNQQEYEKLSNEDIAFNAFVSFTNSRFSCIDIKDTIAFHVIRDPRDIIISGYFSHLFSHPTEGWKDGKLAQYREELSKIDIEAGISKEIEAFSWLFNDLSNWDYTNPKILELKFEEMIINPYSFFIKIFDHLELLNTNKFENIDSMRFLTKRLINAFSVKFFNKKNKYNNISKIELLSIIEKNSFEKLSGKRIPGIEDKKHHFRKGISGDWKNYFTAEHKKLFKNRYNDILMKLGYENNNNW